DLEGLAEVQHVRGLAAICRGDYGQARMLLEASLADFKSLGDEWSVTDALITLATALFSMGDVAGAEARVMEALGGSTQTGPRWDRLGVAEGLEVLAGVEAARDRYEAAARWLGAADGLREAMRAPVPPYREVECDALVGRVKRALPAATFRAAFDTGRALTLSEILHELNARRPS
ncbi:MAG TPA: hypothetical protein VFJ45_04485, partial [bacterium]|nr:hypothetical protein [bacterium]